MIKMRSTGFGKRSLMLSLCTIQCHHNVFLKVIAKNNMRTICERLPEPQPAPKVILKSHAHVQQQWQFAKPSSGKPGNRDWDAATSHREHPHDDDRIFQQDRSQN